MLKCCIQVLTLQIFHIENIWQWVSLISLGRLFTNKFLPTNFQFLRNSQEKLIALGSLLLAKCPPKLEVVTGEEIKIVTKSAKLKKNLKMETKQRIRATV